MTVRTRFAPSPTGELHLGNARTAILNWLFARRHGGAFILRLEDTDPQRRVEGSEAEILEGLDWLGLDRDEDPVRGGPFGPYRQSERLPDYRERAAGLLERGLAFRCYCRPAELRARREARVRAGGSPACDGRCRELDAEDEAALREAGRLPAVRFRVDPGPVAFRDRLRGEIEIDGSDFGDFVILRSDGGPTYNFAAVVDDALMRITHVIRGAGHLANTPKQVLLYRAMGAEPPEFVHVPDVLAPEGGRLSKRRGAPGLSHYRREGYHPDAVVNYLSLLSWSDPEGREVLKREELVAAIDLDRLGKAEPTLDLEKMRWLSGRHIRGEPPEALARRLEAYVDVRELGIGGEELVALAEVVRERIHVLSEAAAEAERIFGDPRPDPDAAAVLGRPGAAATLRAVAEAWESVSEWTRPKIRAAMDRAGEARRLRGGALYRPVRAALTGALRGPELPDLAYALGPSRAVARLRAAAAAAGEEGAAEPEIHG